jgi:hypothetical protein
VIYDPDDHTKLVIDLDKMPVRPGGDRDEAMARHERAIARFQDPAARRQQIADLRAQAAGQAQSASAIQEMLAKAVSQAQPRAPKADIADQLTKLADLRDRGVLSDAEFEAQKVKMLTAS